MTDYGDHFYEFDDGNGHKITLSCKYKVPGLTMHDLTVIYENAYAKGNHLSGDPSQWPISKGIDAVVDAVLKASHKKPSDQ